MVGGVDGGPVSGKLGAIDWKQVQIVIVKLRKYENYWQLMD